MQMEEFSVAGVRLPSDLSELLAGRTRAAAVASHEHAAVIAALVGSAARRPVFLVAPDQAAVERISGLARYLVEFGPEPFDFPRWPSGLQSPYEQVVESPFVAAARLGALATCSLAETPFLLALDAARASARVIPFASFSDGLFQVQVGRPLNVEEVVGLLARAGYRRVSSVVEPGEFSIRNAVLDVFSPFHDEPFRAEVDYDEVETLRFFDPASQRTRRTVDHVWIVPAWDVPCSEAAFRDAAISLRDAAAAGGVSTTVAGAIEFQLSQGRTPPGFPGMLPFLYPEMELPVDYVGDDVAVIVVDPEGCRRSANEALDALAEARNAALEGSTALLEPGERPGMMRPLAAEPDRLAVGGDALLQRLLSHPSAMILEVSPEGGILGPSHRLGSSVDLVVCTAADVPVAERVAALRKIASELVETGDSLLLVAPSEGEARRVSQILETGGLATEEASSFGLAALLAARAGIRVGSGRIRLPFGLESWGVFVMPSEAVFGVKDVLTRRQQERRNIKKIQEFRELSRGDMVIHRDHGMGVFEGMMDVTVDGVVSECLLLSYRGGDRLYVPVDRANLLEKYTPPSEGQSRQLDRLGTQAWAARKKQARSAARDIADNLRKLYARRMASTAPSMSAPDAEFREFEATFQWETTPDQDKAIAEILEDLQNRTPMDRLVCGDVGFGKTEVAIRAAFKAISDGYQVAVLVPTTILAEQHRLTFAARFRNTPAVIESISRFKSPREIRQTLQALRTGGIDVIVGTHRLLSADVQFMNLGLLIIDEEQRFGVAHKERLREMAAGVHTMSLTATPIPRTLHMALSGIRELSLITTPPRDRLAVRTFVARSGMGLIRSAILRETARGGQVFVVHNRVEDIHELAASISVAVPEARICVGHGQMSGQELEAVMSGFVRGDFDVLVATTIVESGLDIGTANTIIIHDADRLGLAQLYQLRGRVGRSSEQAWCYLLVRDPGRLSGEARMRIEAIERFSELASGFNVASMDLAIRGSGEILGAEQSGHLESVGEEMFLEMVREAMDELSGEDSGQKPEVDMKVDVEARLPAQYLPDEKLRLRFYRRLSSASEPSDVDAIAAELADRFGPLPDQARNLVAILRLKIVAAAVGLVALAIRGDDLNMAVGGGGAGTLASIAAAFESAGFVREPGRIVERVRFVFPGAAGARMAGISRVEMVEMVLGRLV